LSALVGLAAASPAPQVMDFNQINNAPSVSQKGPVLAAVTQTNIYDQSSAISAASADVTAAVTTVQKRWIFGFGSGSGSSSCTTSTIAKAVALPSSSSSSKPSSSPSITVTSTMGGNTGTATTSSTTACATTPEAGTYCGFINPEDPCAPQPDGYGHKVTPDTVAAFEAYSGFHKDALNAVTPLTYVQSFRDLNASTSANSYLSLVTLQSYDTQGCSQWCDNTTLCESFNIYIERDPSLNPTEGQCPDPSSITNYKCTLWGSSINATTATNQGGWRDDFQVVIVGSNGYNKINTTITPPSCGSNWNSGSQCSSGGAISKPSCNVGNHFFPGPYNPTVCAAYAEAQTAKNKAAAGWWSMWMYQPCNMFNSYMVKKNGVPMGTYCSLFNTEVDHSWATYFGGVSGSDKFDIETSMTY
ncbi:hypothetical protein K490DRAFT_20598, partial [Saccharata proteae CBS 121410]